MLELLNCLVKLTHIGSNLLERVHRTGLKHYLVPPRPVRNPPARTPAAAPGATGALRPSEGPGASGAFASLVSCNMKRGKAKLKGLLAAAREAGKWKWNSSEEKHPTAGCFKGTDSWVHSTTYLSHQQV